MPGLINLDFADVKKIMADKGKAIMGTGEAEGEDRARIAAEQALSNPILDDCSMKGAKGVLINITGGADITLMEIDEAVNIIKEEVDENAELIFGSSYDDSLSGRIRVSIVVTGIDDDAVMTVEKKEFNDFVDLNPEVTEEVVETVDETPVLETVFEEPLNNVIELSQTRKIDVPEQGEFVELKEESAEPHQPSALFNAIINKPIVANLEETEQEKTELAAIKLDKPFVATSKVKIVEEEPQLFPEQGEVEQPFERKAREEAETQAMIEEEPTPVRQRFIDKILGISRAKAKKPVRPIVVPKFDEIEDFAEKESESEDDLEIPAFLRRK